jgi:hypothetical protein
VGAIFNTYKTHQVKTQLKAWMKENPETEYNSYEDDSPIRDVRKDLEGYASIQAIATLAVFLTTLFIGISIDDDLTGEIVRLSGGALMLLSMASSCNSLNQQCKISHLINNHDDHLRKKTFDKEEAQ